MAIGWYIVPYKRYTGSLQPIRYCAMDDYTATIGPTNWAESEVLGNRGVVKVKATAAILSNLNDVVGFVRLPKNALDDSLSDLSPAVKAAIRSQLRDMGYTLAEIQTRFGDDIGQYTLRDVLRFAATRRLKPRYDTELDEIICDGAIQSCRSIDDIDAEVTG